jgi:7-carboxy-7-deazaguanine synthase
MPDTKSPSAVTVRMNEIYCSVQGESTWAGLPCVFVRLARCNLRCRWCDTKYSFHGGQNQSIDTILNEVRSFGVPLVEITGGEPLAQKSCIPLSQGLVDAGFTVLIETSGSLPIAPLPDEVVRIMDLKCPDSDMSEYNHWPNIDNLRPDRDEVKFVLASRRDYEWSRDIVRRYNLTERCKAVLFSPVFDEVNPKDIVDWMLEDNLKDVRFQLQMHKFIWPPEKRGV